MPTVLRFLLGLVGVAALLGLLLNAWLVEHRINKINVIVADYIGPHESDLDEPGLINYVKLCGCDVTFESDKLIIRLVMGWTRKTWNVPRNLSKPTVH